MAAWWVVGSALLGCSGSHAGQGAKATNEASAAEGNGRSADAPILTCGPQDSYEYVARRYKCSDGSNPFNGDIRRAAASREGSRDSSKNDHHIDVYGVPCNSGKVTVYIDMYGCPEWESRLAENNKQSEEGKKLLYAFAVGGFEKVISQCADVSASTPMDAKTMCLGASTVALHALGRDEQAFSNIQQICAPLPKASSTSNARALVIVMTLGFLADASQQGHYSTDANAASKIATKYAEVCQVPPEQVQSLLDSMNAQSLTD
jgi:hypothetical protein